MKEIISRISMWHNNKKNGAKVISELEYQRLVEKLYESRIIIL